MSYTNDQGRSAWRSIYDSLRQRIESRELLPGAKLPTEAQLVAEHGVSKMTVHRALRELAAAGLVRRQERIGTFVADTSPEAPRRVGLLLPANEGFLEIKYLSGIREALGAKQQVVLFTTDNDPVAEDRALTQAEGEVDGMIVLPTCHPRVAERLKRLHDDGCPVICIDREPLGFGLASVTSDNYAVSKRSLAYLEAAGHRRIAFFGLFSQEMSSVVDRYRAYADFVTERGGDPTETSRLIEPRSSEHLASELRLFRDAMQAMMSGPDPVTAAFCISEHYLSVLLEVCADLPIALQRRFEIVSFCDWPSLTYPHIQTHVIRQDAKAIGRAAAAFLEEAMAADTPLSGRREVPTLFDMGSQGPSPQARKQAFSPDHP